MPDVESSISRKSGQQQHPSHALHLGYVFGRSHAPTTSRGLLQRISATGAPSPVVAYGDGGHLSPRLCKTNSQRQCHVVHWVNLYNMAFESLWAAVQEFSKNKNCPRFDMNVSSRRCSRQGSKVASQIRAKLRSRLHQPTRTYTTASLLVTSSYGVYAAGHSCTPQSPLPGSRWVLPRLDAPLARPSHQCSTGLAAMTNPTR